MLLLLVQVVEYTEIGEIMDVLFSQKISDLSQFTEERLAVCDTMCHVECLMCLSQTKEYCKVQDWIFLLLLSSGSSILHGM